MSAAPKRRRLTRRAVVSLTVLFLSLGSVILVPMVVVLWYFVGSRFGPDGEAIAYVESVGGQVATEHASNRELARRYGLDFDQVATAIRVSTFADAFDVSRLAGLEHLESLSLDCAGMKDEDLRHLATIPNLKHLTLCGGRLTGDCLKHVAVLPNLESLEVRDVSIGDTDLRELSGLSRLKELDLDSPRITDAGMLHLIPLNELKHIRLERAQLAEFGFRDLGQLTNLEAIELPATKVDEAALVHLAALANLQWLRVGPAVDDDFQDPGWQWIGTPQLRAIRDPADVPVTAIGSHLDVPEGADEFLPEFAQHNRLRRMSLASPGIEGTGIVHFKNLTKLKNLVLEDLAVSDKGLVHLANLTGLRNLAITRARISDSGLAALRRCDDLIELVIADTGVTDDGLTALAAAPNLSVVDLVGPGVTDASLELAAGLPELKWLSLNDAESIDRGYFPIRNPEGVQQVEILGSGSHTENDATWADRAACLAVLTEPFSLETNADFHGAAEHLASVENLRSLRLRGVNGDCASLTGLSNLRSLDVAWIAGSSAELPSLTSLSSLETVVTKGALLGRDGLRKICEAPRLQKLSLKGAVIDSATLSEVGGPSALVELDLSEAWLSDAVPKFIAGLRNLRKLDLTNAEHFAHQRTDYLAELPHLEELDLGYSASRDPLAQVNWLLGLAKCRNLRVLRVGYVDVFENGLASLVTLETLEELHLANCELSGDDLKAILLIPNLKVLDLSSASGFEYGFGKIRQSSSVEELNLVVYGRVPLHDGALEAISHLRNLRQLTLPGSNDFTSEGVSRLATLPNLVELTIESEPRRGGLVLISGLKHFENLKVLRFLRSYLIGQDLTVLKQCRTLETLLFEDGCAVDDEQLARLKQALPSCDVHKEQPFRWE